MVGLTSENAILLLIRDEDNTIQLDISLARDLHNEFETIFVGRKG